MSSRITRVSMSSRPAIVAPSSTRETRGSCLRPNVSSWRVSAAPRSVAAPDLHRGRPHRAVLALVEEQVGVTHRHLEQVVEIVRHARGELTDRFHLLRAAYLLLRRADTFERGAQCGLAGAKGSGRLVPAVNQTVADHRDRREHRERNGIPREVAARGKRQRKTRDREHDGEQPGPSASPMSGHRHRGKDRRKRRNGEERPRDARHGHARQGHHDGEAIGLPEAAQDVTVALWPCSFRGRLVADAYRSSRLSALARPRHLSRAGRQEASP